MRPVLGPTWNLCLRGDRAYVERRADCVAVAALSGAEAVALGVMDGTREVCEVEAILHRALGSIGARILRSVMNRLGPLLVDDTPRPTVHALESLAAVLPPDIREGLRWLPGPKVLHWWVTNFCPRRCVYCFARPLHGSRAPDAELERPILQHIFREAASLGAEHLLVAGAEPFLRPDLPEAMGDAVAAGLTPLVTTKYPIDQDLAERLQASGVRHISISVDSFDPDENARLVGSRIYGEQVRRSVQNLNRANVQFSFQVVVTRFNRMAFRGVAEEAARLGARVVQVVPFEPVAAPIGQYENAELALVDKAWLEEEVDTLQRRCPELRIELFEQLGQGDRAGFHCDIGMTKLFFLPNGVVHRCYKLTHDRRLDGRDLRKISVAEAWHDPGFRSVIAPAREAYTNTACGTCGRFDNCHAEGRCIYQAMVDHGSYTAPDRQCSGPYTTQEAVG